MDYAWWDPKDKKIFEVVRKTLEQRRQRYEWKEAGSGIYLAEAPGLIALQLNLEEGKLPRGHYCAAAATSRELTHDEYRVCIRMGKRGGRINARADVLASIPRWGVPSDSSRSNYFPSPEEYGVDFACSLGDIKKWFGRLEPRELNMEYSTLLSLANPKSNSTPRISGDTDRSYWPKDEGEFIFLKGSLDHIYG
jgi:hypothetical protein